MNLRQLAEKLNKVEYGFSLNNELKEICKKERLIVMHGYSDDLLECEGAICDEIGAYGGTEFAFDAEGFIPEYDQINHDDRHEVEHWINRDKKARKFKAIWHNGGSLAWTIETDVPHTTFDIMEDGEVFSRGIIFSLDSL
jgi:hypothetical protein